MCLQREEDSIFLKGRVEGLVLTPNDDSIQLEADIVHLLLRPTGETGMET